MSDRKLRVAFAGTPDFAAEALSGIIAAGFSVPLVMTQPDRPAGRGLKLTPSAVKRVALAHAIEVDQPATLRKPEARSRLTAVLPDVLVVAAYGLILPAEVLSLPRLGCINIHASLLPRWRGAAPIHRAIEAGDEATGITIMQMDEGLDTGPVLLKTAIPVLAHDTTGSLHDRLAALGSSLIVEALDRLESAELTATPQPDTGVTYANKIAKAEAVIDWQRPAAEIDRKIRAFNPFPGAFSNINTTAIKLWRCELADTASAIGRPGQILSADASGIVVGCGDGALRVLELQKPGSKRMPAGEFLRGFAVERGTCFDHADH